MLSSAQSAILLVYVGASVVAFVTYALDKAAAKNNRYRIAEDTLHLIALFGGWPGAFAAQRLLRHKNRKPAFQGTFWATVLVNSCVLGWMLSWA